MTSYLNEMKGYIEANHLAKFKSVLDNRNYSMVDQKSTNEILRIYEILLTTPNRGDFLKLCIEHGCEAEYVNPHLRKAAINYVVESLHFSNLIVLLFSLEDDKYNDKIDVNWKYQEQTPLHYLAKKLTKENVGEIRACMDLLLRKGASINISDNDGKVPLEYVMTNKELLPNDKTELIDMLLLRYGRRNKLKDKAHIQGRLRFYDKLNYLIYVLVNDESAVQVLCQTLNINSDEDNMNIILRARKIKNVKLFKEIIDSNNLNLNQFTSIELTKAIIHEMRSESRDKEGHLNDLDCLKILFKSRHVDVSGADAMGIPLLSYAAAERREKIVKELINHGAYLGMRSNYREHPMAHIRPKILEELLDSFITMVEKEETQDIYINISLRNICHPLTETPKKLVHNDMRAISHIKNARDLQHLLTHPVVTSLLTHKWQLYSKFFYIHLVIHLIFQVLITTLIFFKFYTQKTGTDKIQFACLPFIIYLSICEIVQFLLGSLHYVKSFFVNLINLVTIGLSFLTCFGSDETQKTIAPCTLLLTFFKLFVLLSSLRINFISMPLLMLLEVFKSVLKSSILLVVVAVFSVCFYLEFGEKTTWNSINSTESLTLNFDSILTSFIKSIIMATGEYDASNLKFQSILGYLLIFLFVIFVGISLFNLLIGQAVQDIQMIKDQADIIKAINCINFMNTSEEFLNHVKLYRLDSCRNR
ncbi:transient receptor potential cation channel protein painless-like [Drosophila innubila]|uniref:transient receptor potential cation channel protein painless-like n=1 Tax=Drosophila innubila TaxID=198719 RepID=UPI00148BFC80|nr:transient receptor potential cation channel protein painless-like [Drosophila innubila]